jgi:hypothetical protein
MHHAGPRFAEPEHPLDAALRRAQAREGIFRDHTCWKCKSGTTPCVVSNPNRCQYPWAIND